MKIVFIGAGNLATNLAKVMYEKGFEIIQIYSRTLVAAQSLASCVNAKGINNLADIDYRADLYIISVKDRVLEQVVSTVCSTKHKGIFVHTAGSIPMQLFEGKAEKFGVLYPMQSFSKQKDVDFQKLPFFIEGCDDTVTHTLENIVNTLGSTVFYANSETRKAIHLAAVFACNFANHCYELSAEILTKHGIPFEVMLPLIDETAYKVHTLCPLAAQTGPAVRYDENIIAMQHDLLSFSQRIQLIYDIMSKSIHEADKNNLSQK